MARTYPQGLDAADSRSAQEELADSLLRCMGRESAIHVCKMNGWAGVLDILIKEEAAPAPDKKR